MARVLALPVILLLALTPAAAGPVTQSLRPLPRPVLADLTLVAAPQPGRSAAAPRASLRPMARPEAAGEDEGQMTVQIAAPVVRATTPSRDRKGSVCRNPALSGEKIQRIKGKLRGCGIDDPVLVTAVHGVSLRPAATLNCDAANALADWVDTGLQPAFRGQVVQLVIADSYSCRPRNNVRGNKVSEHGKGNAIDIQAFVLKSGKVLTVEDNYGRQIRRASKAACGTFTTTLGPGSDGYHEDHIHLDVGRHGGSPYCR